MAIVRNAKSASGEARFSVGVNIVLTGSKKLTQAEQDRLLSVNSVNILIVDASDPDNVLVDATAEAKEFSTGSVGYGLNIREAAFGK